MTDFDPDDKFLTVVHVNPLADPDKPILSPGQFRVDVFPMEDGDGRPSEAYVIDDDGTGIDSISIPLSIVDLIESIFERDDVSEADPAWRESWAKVFDAAAARLRRPSRDAFGPGDDEDNECMRAATERATEVIAAIERI